MPLRLALAKPVGWKTAASSIVVLLALLSGSCGGSAAPTAVSANPALDRQAGESTGRSSGKPPEALLGKTIVGYQGWFGCPGENGSSFGAARWRHWFAGQVDQASELTVDMLPDVSELPDSARCITNMRREDGSSVAVYSSASPRAIDLHFRWMAQHDIDGAAIQRFVATLRNRDDRDRLDGILHAIRSAAEAHGRGFYVTYDISGADPATVYDEIRSDWLHLTHELKITSSRAYLKEEGSPLLQLWGFGFRDRPGEPEQVLRLMADLRHESQSGSSPESSEDPAAQAGRPAVLLIGGVPTGWRRAQADSRTGSEWARVYRSFDIVNPWAVGRYHDAATNRAFILDNVLPDIAEAERVGIGYMPVIFPGFSWANLMKSRGKADSALRNQTPRRCGNFLWEQGQSRLAAGAESMFIAMFDEVDEATAVMPVVARKDNLPLGTNLIALDEDGCDLPADWYLRISGMLSRMLKQGQVPPEEMSSVLRP